MGVTEIQGFHVCSSDHSSKVKAQVIQGKEMFNQMK